MKFLSDYIGNTLVLLQPKFFKENYELFLNEETLGTIVFPKFFSRNALLSIDNKQWDIKKESFWKDIYGIYPAGKELPAAKYVPIKINFAEIQFPRGEYITVRYHFFRTAIEILDDRQNIAAKISARSGFKKKFLVDMLMKNKLIDENPWIVLLLCYIKIRKESKAAAASV